MASRKERCGECGQPPIPEQEKTLGMEKAANGKVGAEQLPWDSMLRFRDPALDEEYWASHCEYVKTALDVAWLAMGVFVGLGFLARTLQEPCTSGLGSSEIGTLIATRVLTILLVWKCRAFYKSNRVLIATFLRLQSVVYSVWMFATPPALTWTAWVLARHLMQKCVLIPLVSVVGGMRLSFPEHFFAQGAGCLIGLLWTTEIVCQGWMESRGYQGQHLSAFSAVGRTIDKMIVHMTNYGFPWPVGASTPEPSLVEVESDDAYSCWLVVAFFQVLGAFVIPNLFLYSVESACRAKFLMARTADDDERKACGWAWLHTMLVMVWMGVMTLVVAWLGLKSLEEIWHRAAAIWACPDGAQCVCNV